LLLLIMSQTVTEGIRRQNMLETGKDLNLITTMTREMKA